MEALNSATLQFKGVFKKSVTSFISRFGKFQPESITIEVRPQMVVLRGHTPGTSVSLQAPELFESSEAKKPFRFTVSKDTLATIGNCGSDSALLSKYDSYIQISSGKMKLELPIEESVDHEYRSKVDNPLSTEFQEHLKYALPLLKKTSSTIARSELFLECANENFQTFNIAAVVGTKIHLIESQIPCTSVYQNSKDGISILAPFDLLEGIQSADEANLLIDKNTLVVTESGCTSSTQTREHSLGVGYDIVLDKVKQVDEGSLVFNVRTERFLQMMTDLPKPPSNSEYTLEFSMEPESMSISYKGKGVRFSDSFKVTYKEAPTEVQKFSVEYSDIMPIAQALEDTAEKCTMVLSKSRLIIKAKSGLGYNHFIALARVA